MKIQRVFQLYYILMVELFQSIDFSNIQIKLFLVFQWLYLMFLVIQIIILLDQIPKLLRKKVLAYSSSATGAAKLEEVSSAYVEVCLFLINVAVCLVSIFLV